MTDLTPEFIAAFKLLSSKLDDIDLARYLHIDGKKLKQIKSLVEDQENGAS